MKPGVARLFLSVEECQCREDEGSDFADNIQPVFELHTRHLLPSRKKADTSNCLPRRMLSYVQKLFKPKLI